MFVVTCKNLFGMKEIANTFFTLSLFQIIRGEFRGFSTDPTHSAFMERWDFLMLLCLCCPLIPMLCFVSPQWVCVLADGNRWDRQPRGRSSPGSSPAGERHHPPWLASLAQFFPTSLRPALPSFAPPYPNIYHSLIYFALHGVEHAICLT